MINGNKKWEHQCMWRTVRSPPTLAFRLLSTPFAYKRAITAPTAYTNGVPVKCFDTRSTVYPTFFFAEIDKGTAFFSVDIGNESVKNPKICCEQGSTSDNTHGF